MLLYAALTKLLFYPFVSPHLCTTNNLHFTLANQTYLSKHILFTGRNSRHDLWHQNHYLLYHHDFHNHQGHLWAAMLRLYQ